MDYVVSAAVPPVSSDLVDALKVSLGERTALESGDYWSFRDASRARDDGVLFQYPAMMVSPMQGALLDVLLEHRTDPLRVLDPFVGSGTTMIESMRRGLEFHGSDLNPLAVMIARVETTEAVGLDLGRALDSLMRRAGRQRGRAQVPAEPWATKWFRPDVLEGLAALREAIRREGRACVRRLWWVCFAETCRLSGNARVSTPKLHIRLPADRDRQIEVLQRFRELAERAVGVLERRNAELRRRGHVKDGYSPGVTLDLADARDLGRKVLANVVLTSPPYGDNHTTMPYGQASFLPLRWIDLKDAACDVPDGLIATTKSLDTASLGGSRRTATLEDSELVSSRSPTLTAVLMQLGQTSREAWQRVSAFFIDYDRAWNSILSACEPDAHLVLTLGDRTVRGLRIPTEDITRELLASRGLAHVETLNRAIPHNKRLARRNRVSSTIGKETVLVMQRTE